MSFSIVTSCNNIFHMFISLSGVKIYDLCIFICNIVLAKNTCHARRIRIKTLSVGSRLSFDQIWGQCFSIIVLVLGKNTFNTCPWNTRDRFHFTIFFYNVEQKGARINKIINTTTNSKTNENSTSHVTVFTSRFKRWLII